MKIEHLHLDGLHGTYGNNLHFQFKDNILILVGENNSGKTLALNVLDKILNHQWSYLANLPIGKIEIKFENHKPIVMNQDDMFYYPTYNPGTFEFDYQKGRALTEQLNNITVTKPIMLSYLSPLLGVGIGTENPSQMTQIKEICKRYGFTEYQLGFIGFLSLSHNVSHGQLRLLNFLYNLFYVPIKRFLIVDDPEIGLSIDWQRKLLPELMATGQVEGMMIATHSPFIFENEFDKYAHGIGEFRNAPSKSA